MHCRLCTLLIVLAIAPPILAGIITFVIWLRTAGQPNEGNWEYRGQPPGSPAIHV